MEDNIIHYNTEEPVCPHCGFEFYSSEDLTLDEDMIDCVSCGEKFDYRKNIFITWDTEKP